MKNIVNVKVQEGKMGLKDKTKEFDAKIKTSRSLFLTRCVCQVWSIYLQQLLGHGSGTASDSTTTSTDP